MEPAMSTRRPILILESDPVIAQMLDAVLRSGGFRSVFAADGRSAIELLHQEEPAAVVVDVNLHPGVLEPGAHRGVGFLRHLSRTAPQVLERTVVLTALQPQKVASELPDVHRLMEKPFDVTELLRAIGECTADEAEPRPLGSVKISA